MKSKKYAYLFATTVLLANAATTPMTVIAETMQENPSSEVIEKSEKQGKNQEETSNGTPVEEKQEQPQEVPATNSEKVEEGQPKEETPVTPEETPVVENEEKAPEGAANAEVEPDAGATTNQEARLADWETKDKGSYILITKYTGSSPDIVVPNEIDGKPTKLKDIDSTVFPNLSSATSFKVLPREDGTKVGVESTDLSNAFMNATLFETIDLSGLDTSKVTDMSSLFEQCQNLRSLNLSNFNTSEVTNMSKMFNACNKLENLDVSSFNTSKVTDMQLMFNSCNKLESLDVRNFDTSEVTNMNSMFSCYNLRNLDLSKFNTNKVTTMSAMFYYASKLEHLDLSNFDTSKVTNMNYMFSMCGNLRSLDLSNFNTSQTKDIYAMFQECSPDGTVIKTNDSKILNYDFKNNWVFPLVTPVLDANGGQFKNQTNTKQYFTKVAYTSEEFNQMNKLSAFEQFKKDNIPTNGNKDFVGWKLVEGDDTTATNVVPDLLGTKYQAQWVAASVTVKYVFEDTEKEIAQSKTIEGKVGEAYDATTSEYKLNIDGYVLDESRLPDNAKGTFSKEAKEVVYYYKAAPLSLENGSFEEPVISNPNLSPLGYYWQGYISIPGWKTTGSHIELQKAGPNFKIPAVDGNQWAEINYDRNAALYQDIKTTPGDTLYWEVYHRGTDGT
ncbi:MAG: BspA family leucine-rich repeat surface protein, partial [Clostridiales bacterium]|nr:BspA family leucine-rich repeat surface protein [Clostridiales bacterium]